MTATKMQTWKTETEKGTQVTLTWWRREDGESFFTAETSDGWVGNADSVMRAQDNLDRWMTQG